MNKLDGEHQANDPIPSHIANMLKSIIVKHDDEILDRASRVDSLVDDINERFIDIESGQNYGFFNFRS